MTTHTEAQAAIKIIRKLCGKQEICCNNPVPGYPGDGFMQPPDGPQCCQCPDLDVNSLLDVISAALASHPVAPVHINPLRDVLQEVLTTLEGHPAYEDLSMDEEIEVGGDTATFSYLVRQIREVIASTVITPAEPTDPMDWPLPCDVTVGHGTMRKGVPLRTLVQRMKVLYKMATGNDADEVAARTPQERMDLLSEFLNGPTKEQEQAAFEVWLYRELPSGDVEDIQRKWQESDDYADLFEPGPAPICQTCNGHGMIGGPSFHAPDEGGVPCPDCSAPDGSALAFPGTDDIRTIADVEAQIKADNLALATSKLYEPVSMPQLWSVVVTTDGEDIVSIGECWMSGCRPLDERDEQTILGAAQHLLSFIGHSLPTSDFNPDAAPSQQAAPADPVTCSNELGELIGSFDAALGEGLCEALSETTDERLKDLVERRLLAGYYIAIGPSAAPQPAAVSSEPVRQPLTDKQLREILDTVSYLYQPIKFARSIEAAHGIQAAQMEGSAT